MDSSQDHTGAIRTEKIIRFHQYLLDPDAEAVVSLKIMIDTKDWDTPDIVIARESFLL
jgi:hypothetical protein